MCVCARAYVCVRVCVYMFVCEPLAGCRALRTKGGISFIVDATDYGNVKQSIYDIVGTCH